MLLGLPPSLGMSNSSFARERTLSACAMSEVRAAGD
jgi:hypothetical protein